MLRLLGFVLLGLVTLLLLALAAIAAFQQGTALEILAGFSGKPLWLIGVLAIVLLLPIMLFHAWLKHRRTTLVLVLLTVGLGLSLAFNSRHALPDETVRFSSHGVMLDADLYRVDDADAATVVIVHGSADFPRSFYQYWASQLHAMGLNVLLPDKRGAGNSGGVFERNNNGSEKNLGLLADDVAAAVDHVADIDRINRDRIGLFGLSQAGWTAPMAALKQPEIDFMILLTAPAVSTHEESVWSELRGDDETASQVSFAEADRILETTAAAGVDAREALARLDIPVLWLFGDRDNSIPSRKSVAVIDQFSARGLPYRHVTYPGFGHIMMTPLTDGRPRMCDDIWPEIRDWLRQISQLQAPG